MVPISLVTHETTYGKNNLFLIGEEHSKHYIFLILPSKRIARHEITLKRIVDHGNVSTLQIGAKHAMAGRTHLVLREEDVVKLVCEFLENRAMTISQISLERESGVINGDLSDDIVFLRKIFSITDKL